MKNPINSKIKPHESGGYICWDTVPSANYVVSIFEQINGQVIHAETKTLSKVLDLQREIEVGNGSFPYNQIRVTLLFDGRSSVQQTALK